MTSAANSGKHSAELPDDLGHTLDAPLGNQIVQEFQLRLRTQGCKDRTKQEIEIWGVQLVMGVPPIAAWFLLGKIPSRNFIRENPMKWMI